MDSDIAFKNDNYLDDLIKYINNDNCLDLAAIGLIVQRQLFKLSINKIIPSGLLDLITVESRLNKIQLSRKLSLEIFKLLSNIIFSKKVKRESSLSRYPRLRTVLLAINRDYFVNKKLRSGFMHLDVDNIDEKGEKTIHRVFGDSGSALLCGIALNGGKVININVYKYITHAYKGSYGEMDTISAGRWNWFNNKFTDDPIKND